VKSNSLFLIILLSIIFSQPLNIFAAPPVLLEEGVETYPLGPHLDILEDRVGAWTIGDVRSEGFAEKWVPNKKSAPNYGVTQSVFWVRFRLKNPYPSMHQVFLKLANPFLDHITVYCFENNRLRKEIRSGELLPFQQRKIPNHHFVFELRPDARQWMSVYLKIRTNGVMDLPLELLSTKAFIENTKHEYTGYAIYFGIIISMIIYNLFLYFSIQEPVYFHYVLFLSAMSILNLSATGLANEYLWPASPLWGDRATNIFVAVTLAFGALFVKSYLNIKQNLPSMNKSFILIIWAALFMGGLATFDKTPLTMTLLYSMVVIVVPIAIIVGIVCWIRKVPATQIYLIAWIVFLVGTVIRSLKALGVLSSLFITENSLFIGSIVEMLLFSFGLADKINQEREAKFAAQQVSAKSLIEKEDAEIANRAKSRFLANMSHEIRTPLNAVTGFAELLSATVTDAKQKGYINSIKTAAKNLLSLINDILDLSAIEAGKVELQKTPVSLKQMFDEMAQIFSLKLSEKHIRLIIDVPDDIPDALLLDETRIRQILLNLVGNSVKFTEQGYIRLSAEKLSEYDQTVDLMISVEDTGIGIAPEDQEKIFHAFAQQSDQLTGKDTGTGLGLAISKRFVELMNGRIELESIRGKGSTFHVMLENIEYTTLEKPKEDRATYGIEDVRFKNGYILIADDIESSRMLLKELLTKLNLNCTTAENGRELLLLVQEKKPDCIIMDIRMPKMDGYEAVQILKMNPVTREVPVIALTASATENEKSTGLKCGFEGFLTKPIDTGQLVSELMRYLEYTIVANRNDDPDDEGLFSETVPVEDIKDPESFFPKLIQEILPAFMDLKKNMSMKNINAFARELQSIGENHCVKILVEYGFELEILAQQDDMGAMERLFQSFESDIKRITRKPKKD